MKNLITLTYDQIALLILLGVLMVEGIQFIVYRLLSSVFKKTSSSYEAPDYSCKPCITSEKYLLLVQYDDNIYGSGKCKTYFQFESFGDSETEPHPTPDPEFKFSRLVVNCNNIIFYTGEMFGDTNKILCIMSLDDFDFKVKNNEQ